MEPFTLALLGKELGELSSSIHTAVRDGSVSIGDGIDITKELATLSFVTLKNKDILVDILDDGINEEELAEFSTGFATGYDVDSDIEEKIVEEAMAGALALVKGILTFTK